MKEEMNCAGSDPPMYTLSLSQWVLIAIPPASNACNVSDSNESKSPSMINVPDGSESEASVLKSYAAGERLGAPGIVPVALKVPNHAALAGDAQVPVNPPVTDVSVGSMPGIGNAGPVAVGTLKVPLAPVSGVADATWPLKQRRPMKAAQVESECLIPSTAESPYCRGQNNKTKIKTFVRCAAG